MLDIEKTLDIVNGKMKRGKSAFTRDYGAQLSLSKKIPKKDIFTKTLQNFSNVFGRKKSKKDYKSFIDKPVNTKLLSEGDQSAYNNRALGEDEKKEDNVKTSIVKDIKEEDKKNPFFEDERIEYNTKTSIIENANEQDDNKPVFKDEKVEDSTKISVNEDKMKKTTSFIAAY